MAGYPNDQDNPNAKIPVYIVGPGGIGQGYTPLGYQQITSLVAAEGLTPPAGATLAVIIPEAASIRYRDDGTAPTATVGMPMAAGQSLQYSGDLTAIEFIEQVGSAILNVSYYK